MKINNKKVKKWAKRLAIPAALIAGAYAVNRLRKRRLDQDIYNINFEEVTPLPPIQPWEKAIEEVKTSSEASKIIDF